MTARLGHVVEALDDLRQLQRDTESALEEQCRQTEAERQLRSRMEESLQAESQLRRDAEASVQIYREQLELMRAQVRDQHSSSSDHHSRARSIIDMLATLIADKSSLESNLEMANQLLAQLSAEVTRSWDIPPSI